MVRRNIFGRELAPTEAVGGSLHPDTLLLKALQGFCRVKSIKERDGIFRETILHGVPNPKPHY